MKNLWRILSIVFLALSMILSAVGCGNSKNASTINNTDEKKENQPLVLRLQGGDWGEPTPYKHYPRGPGMNKMRFVFDSLLERGEKGIIPWLAESYNVENHGKDYIFNIRKNIKWHDGKEFTSDDVKFSFEYFVEHPPVINTLVENGESMIDDIAILKNNKVRITVKEPDARTLEKIGSVRIIPKHIWENVKDPQKFDSAEAAVGCGPYTLKEYCKEQGTYKFEAFKDYWGPKPIADSIEYVPVSDSVLAFENGEVDIISAAPDILSRYENNKDYKIIQNSAFWGYRLLLNMDKNAELKEKDIRQAIAYALNIDEIIEKTARGAAIPSNAGYIPADSPWYNENVNKYNYNIEKAKELMKGRKLSLELLTEDRNREVRVSELIKIDLEKIGIDVNIKTVDMKTRNSYVKSNNYQLALFGKGDWGGDPDRLRRVYASQISDEDNPYFNNIPGYENEKINKLCEEQIKELDKEKRKAVIFELQEIISDELPVIPIYNTKGYLVYRPSKYDGWAKTYDNYYVIHNKLSYLERE